MKYQEHVVVEAGIAYPPRQAYTRYPFATMEVGQSFTVKDGTLPKVRAAACQYGLRNAPKKFSIRISDPVKKTYRCWRIA